MLNDSLAPIKRAFTFFGFMGVVVATLTFGAGLQAANDQSSTTVAQTKLRENLPAENRFAAVDPGQKVADRTKRAIATSQEARLAGPAGSVLR
jgi:hypothetical protein